MPVAVQRTFDDLGTPLRDVTFVVLDVETTGGSPATSSLTEVAAARYRAGELLGTYQTFVRPDERIPPFITALTGISDAMVADAPTTGAMLPSFLEFVGGAVVVGHNVRFDLSFLDHALVSTGRDRLANATVDTLALARRLVRDMVPNCKLGTLAEVLRLPHRPSHRALTDVLATGDLLHALLERAGSFGILGLEELLDLPRLVGHPQGAKLKLTTRLPHRPGVYWFTDAVGNVLYVGKATDLQARVRSYFTGDRRPNIGRLLRQMDAVHHHVCPGPFTAEVIEGRLIRAWSPPYNRQGKSRRTSAGGSPMAVLEVGAATDGAATDGAATDGAHTDRAATDGAHTDLDHTDLDHTDRAATTGAVPRSRPGVGRRAPRRKRWTDATLAGDPTDLLAPLADRLTRLAAAQEYEEAARLRDEAERLRHLLERHRRVESLRRAGRLVLLLDGEGAVELDGGLLVGPADSVGTGAGVGASEAAMAGDGSDNERIIVAQWLHANAERVRVLHVASTDGWWMPADPIPTLRELCGGPAA